MKLNYRKYGSGPALLICHGLFGSADNWHSLAKRWAEYFQVYTLDLRNHGGSPHESVMTYDEMAADVIEFINHKRLTAVKLLGHSMGGKVAMKVATQLPENIDGLAVLDIGMGKTEGEHGPILDVLDSLKLENFDSRKELGVAMGAFVQEQSKRQFLLKNIMRRVDGSFSWRFNRDALLDNYDTLAGALELEDVYLGQTLFLRGGLSNYLGATLEPGILQFFPLARQVTLEKAGHWLHAEEPDKVFAIITDFFHGIPKG